MIFLKQFHNMLTQCVPCYALGVYKSIYLSFVACVLYINSTLGPKLWLLYVYAAVPQLNQKKRRVQLEAMHGL